MKNRILNPTVRILLVDDNKEELEVLRHALNNDEINYDITLCERVEDALDFIHSDNAAFDIVLSNCELSDKSGLDLLSEIRNNGSEIPVALVGSGSSDDIAKKAFENGVDDYIIKDKNQEYLKVLPLKIPDIIKRNNPSKSKKTSIYNNKDILAQKASIFETISDGLMIVDFDGRIVSINSAFEDLTRFTNEEIIGRSCIDVISEMIKKENLEVVYNNLKNAFVGRVFESEVISLPIIKKNDEVVQVSFSTTAIENSDNEPVAILLGLRDLSDLEETKEALQESEVKYKALFELSHEAIFIIDLDGTIIDCNEAGLRIENKTRDRIIGKSFTELGAFDKNEMLKFMELFSKLIDGEDVNPIEIDLPREHDSKLWLEIIPGLLKMDDEVYAIQIIARDISERKRAEDELSIKDNAIESSLNAIAISNLDGEVTYVNPSFLKIWNCTDDSQIIGKPAVDFWDMGENALEVMKSLREQGNWFGELQAKKIDGKQFDIQVSMSMISDKSEIPIGIMASIIDITERKNMEKKIIKKLDREKRISQISTRFLNAKDLTKVIKSSLGVVGILAEASHGYLYLYDKEFKIKNESLEWCSAGVKSSLKATLSASSTEFSWLEKELKNGEIVYVPDVSRLPIELQNEKKLLEERDVKSAIFLPLIVRGKLVGFIGFDNIEKISNWNEEDKTFLKLFAEILGNAFERKKSDENLQNAFEDIEKSISYLNATLESTDDGILVVDLDGIVKIFNRNFVEIWDVPGSLMSTWNNEKIMEFLQDQLKEPEDLLNTKENVKNDVTQESYKIIETTKNRIFECYSKPQLIRDEIIGRVWSFRDITIRKRAEDELKQLNEELENRVKERTIELEKTYEKLRETQEQFYQAQKLDSIGILAGGIAHDFNNILTGILGNISLIKISVNNDEYLLKLLAESEHGCVRAKDLTQQLLTFSKGGAPIKKASSIVDLIQETASFISCGLKVKCNFSMPNNILPVEIDEGQISQVVNNLIINADQAMPNGGIIDIIVENMIMDNETTQEEEPSLQLDEGKYVKILVKDSGIGIPETHLQKIFEPYFSTKEKGSGLGLATAYSIIKNHDGQIKVNSELGKGTIFTIYLLASEESLPKKGVNENLNVFDQEKHKILVLDDEEIILELVGEILSRSGYETIFAKDGAEAIELYQEAKSSKKPFDAVIMDLTIPGGMGGKEAIQRLREFDPDIKAIVSSGYSNDPIMADPKKYGFIDVIAKPYRIEELSKVVNNIVNDEN